MRQSTRQLPKSSVKRSVVKSVSYRVVILITDFTVIYILTRQIAIATAFMIISNIYSSIIYYFHERIWSNIKWGYKRLRSRK